MRKNTKLIALIVTLLVAALVCVSHGSKEGALAFEMSTCLVVIFGMFPDKKDEDEIKGIIQFDKEHYDVPAMRIVFDGDPIKIINYDEVRFKVDINADLRELDDLT